ncbi:MAG TPA: septal ring lytic transglycosylase RlpA family protein [Sphingomonadaceae bacterium]
MLLLVSGSIATPGVARDQARQLAGSASFADSFAPYAATPASPQVSAGAVDVSALPAPQPDASEPEGQAVGAGLASWYGAELAGHRTASGERFDPSDLTAAHRSLPLGSHVRVTDERTGRSVVVRINDRGPYSGGRVIDLSQAAARELGIMGHGEARVSLALLD